MRYMGSLLGNQAPPSRDVVRAQMATLPPVDPADVAMAKTYADLVRDDYAVAAGEVVDATAAGRRVMIQRYAIGAVAGLAVGGLVGYFAGKR